MFTAATPRRLLAPQEGRPLLFHPAALYRGYFMNVASIVPVTCVQFGAARVFEQALLGPRGDGAEMSSVQRVGVSAAAGACSALVSTPTELMIIQQQRTCAQLLPTAARVLREHGVAVLLRGLARPAAPPLPSVELTALPSRRGESGRRARRACAGALHCARVRVHGRLPGSGAGHQGRTVAAAGEPLIWGPPCRLGRRSDGARCDALRNAT